MSKNKELEKGLQDLKTEIFIGEEIDIPILNIIKEADPQEVIDFLNYDKDTLDKDFVNITVTLQVKVDLEIVLGQIYNNFSETEILKIQEYCENKKNKVP
jgi:hypothetical protein